MDADALYPARYAIEKWTRWRHIHLAGSVDQALVLGHVEENSRWSFGYLFYVVTSAAIAIFGLLQNSPAVIIGAMLIAPLMGPIMGMGFSLATFDFRAMKRAAKALALGSLVAVLFTALIVFISPIKTLTSELAARTQPNLLDLGVAFFSGLAGAYATIREKHGTIVGVAIATALMPPLATVGFGIATGSARVTGGAFLLFMTNFMTIAFTTTIVARLFGFGHFLSPRQGRWQAIGIIVSFALLATPLALTLMNLAHETRRTSEISGIIAAAYGDAATVDELTVNYDGDPVDVRSVVIAPRLLNDEQITALSARIDKAAGRKANLRLTQLRAENSAAVLEREKIRALASNAASEQQKAEAVSGWLSERTGVLREAMMVDAERKRIELDLSGGLARRDGTALGWTDYRSIEAEAETAHPGWAVRLRPPLLVPLPPVTGEGVDARIDPQAVALMGWASQRLRRPLLIGRQTDDAADAAAAIGLAGGTAELDDGEAAYRWGEARQSR